MYAVYLVDAAQALSPASFTTVCSLCIYVLWRFWRFSVQPSLHPEEPKELPYAVPFVGHLWQFFNDADRLISRARSHFGDTREPFALSVAGTKTYVLTRSEDVAAAYRNTTTFSFDIFVQNLMRSCGTSEKSIQAMFAPTDASAGFPNPRSLPLGRLSRELHISQLFPGKNYDELGIKFVKAFEERLNWAKIVKENGVSSSKDEVVLPLMAWTSDVFTLAGQTAYFGPLLAQIDSEMHKTFLTFDDLGWQVLYQYPRILSGQMSAARDKLVQSLEAYFSTPQGERTGDAWFVKTEENEMRARGIGTHDVATMMLPIYWGINTNTRKLAFWLLCYILSDDSLVDVVRKESLSTLNENGQVDPQKVESCTRLNGAFNEAIRLCAFSASVRYVTDDTLIGDKVLRRGCRLMIPYRQLHYNSGIFGDDIEKFDSQRFIRNEKLLRSQSWRPFGGGSTMCPGRYVARQAVCTFVVMLFSNYNVQVEPGQTIPEAETQKPVLGIMDRKQGSSDVLIRMKVARAMV